MSAIRKRLDLGKVRTRYEPPTLEDAIFAAQGLTADMDEQVEIAAQLSGRPAGEVRAALLQSRPAEVRVVQGAPRRQPLIVERRHTRRVVLR